MRSVILATVLCLGSALTTVQAQDYKTLLDIPQGATLVNLSATERADVDQDLLVATLRYEAQKKQPRPLQNEINTVMAKALAAARQVASVKTATQAYQVYQYDLNQGKRHLPPDTVWRGQQGLVLKGKQADDLLELVAGLQELGFSMSDLSYTVSPELLEEKRESLLEAALIKLRAKAERTALTIGKRKTDFLQIDVDMGDRQPPPMLRSMAMAEAAPVAEMAAPVAAPGQSEITLTVTATALLSN